MNPRVEKLLKLPLYQTVGHAGGGRFWSLSALAVWFLGMPLYEELTGLKQEAQKLDGDIAQKRLVANNLPKFKAEFAKMEKQLEKALTKLPNQSEIPSLVDQSGRLGQGQRSGGAEFQAEG